MSAERDIARWIKEADVEVGEVVLNEVDIDADGRLTIDASGRLTEPIEEYFITIKVT